MQLETQLLGAREHQIWLKMSWNQSVETKLITLLCYRTFIETNSIYRQRKFKLETSAATGGGGEEVWTGPQEAHEEFSSKHGAPNVSLGKNLRRRTDILAWVETHVHFKTRVWPECVNPLRFSRRASAFSVHFCVNRAFPYKVWTFFCSHGPFNVLHFLFC